MLYLNHLFNWLSGDKGQPQQPPVTFRDLVSQPDAPDDPPAANRPSVYAPDRPLPNPPSPYQPAPPGIIPARPPVDGPSVAPVADLPTPPAPSVAVADARSLGPPPTLRDSQGRAVLRPSLVNTGDPVADRADYERQLQDYTNPLHRGNRFGAGLKQGGRAAINAFVASGGNPYAALVGLATGFGYGSVEPNIVDREWRNRQLNTQYSRDARDIALRDEQLKQMGMSADIGLKQSEVYKNFHPAPKFEIKDTDSGPIAVDLNDPRSVPVPLPYKLKDPADSYTVQQGTDEAGKPAVYAVNTHDPKDVVPLPFGPKPGPQMVTRTLADGTQVQVPASAALSADSQIRAAERTGYGQDVQAENEQAQRERERQIKQAQDDYQREVSNRREAQAAVANYNTVYGQLQKNLAAVREYGRNNQLLESTKNGMDSQAYQKNRDALDIKKGQLEEENRRLVDEVNAAGAELSNGRHTKYVRQRADGTFEVGPEIPKPEIPPVAPVKSRRMPAARGRGDDPLGLFTP